MQRRIIPNTGVPSYDISCRDNDTQVCVVVYDATGVFEARSYFEGKIIPGKR